MLAIPSHTSHGTLLQLVGLAMPFSAAVVLLLMGEEIWYPSAEKVPWTQSALAPFAGVMMFGLFLYPLAFGLVCWMQCQSATR